MNYFDILPDDMIIKILDIRCDEIEKQIEKLENLEEDYYDAEYFMMEKYFELHRHFNQSPIDDEPNRFFDYYDPYDTDEIDQYYQDEIYLANLSSNI